jgi:hypothetical protein
MRVPAVVAEGRMIVRDPLVFIIIEVIPFAIMVAVNQQQHSFDSLVFDYYSPNCYY